MVFMNKNHVIYGYTKIPCECVSLLKLLQFLWDLLHNPQRNSTSPILFTTYHKEMWLIMSAMTSQSLMTSFLSCQESSFPCCGTFPEFLRSVSDFSTF